MKYSLADIHEMRTLEWNERAAWRTDDDGRDLYEGGSVQPDQPEDRLRTYMLAGITPADMKEVGEKRDAERAALAVKRKRPRPHFSVGDPEGCKATVVVTYASPGAKSTIESADDAEVRGWDGFC